MSQPEYTPTPDEIREACRQIREGWTDIERHRRSTTTGRVEWQLPGMQYADYIDRETERDFHE